MSASEQSSGATRVVVLIDGSNVAHSDAWRAASKVEDLAERNRRLVDAVCGWAAGEGYAVTLVFDGTGPYQRGARQVTAQVEVVGSGDEDGDATLERRAAEQRRLGVTHGLASRDRVVRQVAGAGAARMLSAEELVAALARPGADGDPAATAFSRPDPTRLMETIDAEVRAQLEQLRRGNPPTS